MAKKEQWMQGAVNPMHEGMFSEKAHEAHMSTGAYAANVLKPSSQASTATKRQAVLSQTFKKYRPGGKPSKSSVARPMRDHTMIDHTPKMQVHHKD